MEFKTILVSVAGSFSIVGLITYVMKKSFDNSLKLRMDELLEKTKNTIQEESRKKEKIANEQFGALKTALSLTYRARNCSRDLYADLQSNYNHDDHAANKRIPTLIAYTDSIAELLFEERAILPNEVFLELHEIKEETYFFINVAKSIKTKELSERKKELEEKQIQTLCKTIDSQYNNLSVVIREHLGVELVSSE